MPRVGLTDRFVASAQSDKRENYFDTKALGLSLRVSPSGTKTWYFVYRTKGQPSQWLKIGTYPALPLATARKAVLDQRKALEVDGVDPVVERKAAKQAREAPSPAVFTFNDLAKLYLPFAKATKKTWRDDKQKMDRYLIPAWGPRPLRGVTRAHVHELLDSVVAQGMGAGVNRVQALISRVFTVALDRSLIDAHPAVRMIKRAKEQPRDRILSEDEICALCQGLDEQPGSAADAVRLRLLLGQRGAEVNGMCWAHVKFESATWVIPAELTKNGRPHTVALGTTAIKLLTRRRALTPDDEPRVFPGLSMQSLAYRKLAAIHGGRYEWKDLRRTMATGLAGLGFSETTIGRCLNHARYTVTAKHYNQHLYLAETRAALEAWDQEINRIAQKRKRRRTP